MSLLEKNVLDDIGFIKLIRVSEDPILETVNAARISYEKQSEKLSKKDLKLANYLYKHEHTSPFRHSYYTFHIKAPLFVFRQWVKYQVGSVWRQVEVDGKYVSIDVFDLLFDNDKGCSWNEISGRYVQLEPEFYIPKVFRGNVEHGSKQKSEPLQKDPQWHEQVRKNWLERTKNSYAAYIADLGSGIAREQARSMLPQNIYTQAIWTVSLQSIMHFLSQRCKEDAQHEIREYANTIKSLCIKHTPNLSKILE